MAFHQEKGKYETVNTVIVVINQSRMRCTRKGYEMNTNWFMEAGGWVAEGAGVRQLTA